jgi:hypothetical protein
LPTVPARVLLAVFVSVTPEGETIRAVHDTLSGPGEIEISDSGVLIVCWPEGIWDRGVVVSTMMGRDSPT